MGKSMVSITIIIATLLKRGEIPLMCGKLPIILMKYTNSWLALFRNLKI
jgi:hypothetical protein